MTSAAARQETEKLVEVYFRQPGQTKEEFLDWYRNFHLPNVEAIKSNDNIVRAEILEVQDIEELNVIVIIEIKKGSLPVVGADPGVAEILKRASQHGMKSSPVTSIPIP